MVGQITRNNCFIIISVFGLMVAVHGVCAGQTFVESDKIVSSDRAALQHFGFSVALSEKYAVIGSFSAAYIYERQISGTWRHAVKLNNPERLGGGFGQKVSLNRNTAFICASHLDVGEGNSTSVDAGAVYVFERDDKKGWVFTQKIVTDDMSSYSYFGSAISSSGDFLAVGAYRESRGEGIQPVDGAGAVYIFKKGATGGWEQVQKITASDRSQADFFGSSVNMSATNLIVGASSDVGELPGSHNGSAYIFTLHEDGRWREQQKLTAPESDRIKGFGKAVAISQNYAVITNDTLQSVHIFNRMPEGHWQFSSLLIASDQSGDNLFGGSIAATDSTIVVGASYQKEINQGAVYLFVRSEEGTWREKQKFTSSHRSAGNEFGAAISQAGRMLLVGSFLDEKDTHGENILERAGAAYVYSLETDRAIAEKPPTPAAERCPDFVHDFVIPNVLTPNGDGLNDVFYLAKMFDRTSLTVFDRYGKIIYENDNYNNEWSPVDVGAGVYYWKLIQQKNRCLKEFKGWVHVTK